MATDKSLAALLRALQSASGEQDISRILDSATNLYTLLLNPSNVSLLTSQILSAPAIWRPPTLVQTAGRVINVFTSASIRLLQLQETSEPQGHLGIQRRLRMQDWTVAVIKGVSVASPRSRHALVFAGLLQGFESQGRQGISTGLHNNLQDALITAINLSLQEDSQGTIATDPGLIFATSLVFEMLDSRHKTRLDYRRLLPALISVIFTSDEGLRQGYFLSSVDEDIVEGARQKFHWSIKSPSYRQLQFVASSPLVAGMGRVSRLAAFAIGQIKHMTVVTRLLEDLSEFSRSLSVQWRQNKLSEIDTSEEQDFLSDGTLRTPVPLLWRLLRDTMFAIVVILSSCTGYMMSSDLQRGNDAPFSAVQMLNIFRHLCFITTRLGTDTLSEYTFVYLAAIDILSQYPMNAGAFLKEIQPSEIGRIPRHPLDRNMDFFFLTAAEQLTFILDANVAKELLTPAASPYLSTDGDPRLLPIFEAAHSVMLNLLAAPHNADLAASQIESYARLLFQVFPRLLSPRQFRLAIKQLVRITSPPSLISVQRPLLSSIILEVVHSRLRSATSLTFQPVVRAPIMQSDQNHVNSMSEQCALVHALIDSLPFLEVSSLEDWLPTTAASVHSIQEPTQRDTAKYRFWEVLSNGEMDVARAAVCVAWWATRGGRELLLHGGVGTYPPTMMSGALNEISKL